MEGGGSGRGQRRDGECRYAIGGFGLSVYGGGRAWAVVLPRIEWGGRWGGWGEGGREGTLTTQPTPLSVSYIGGGGEGSQRLASRPPTSSLAPFPPQPES